MSAPHTRHQRGMSMAVADAPVTPQPSGPRGVDAAEATVLVTTEEEARLPADEPLTERATFCAAGMPMAGGTPGVHARRALKDSSSASTR